MTKDHFIHCASIVAAGIVTDKMFLLDPERRKQYQARVAEAAEEIVPGDQRARRPPRGPG